MQKEAFDEYSEDIFFIVTVLILSFPSLVSAQGYHIEITLKGLSSDTVILGEYFTTRMIPKDTIVLDRKGHGVFEGTEPFQGGLYLVYYSPSRYFDMLLGDDQEFSIWADTSDFVNSIEFSGSDDNHIFQDYKNYLQLKRGEIEKQQSRLANAKSETDSIDIRDEIKHVNGDMEAYMDRIEADHASLFVKSFVGATREPFPPEDIMNGERRHDDSIRYFYYRNHYFDRFDPFDIRLL
ncbi:MAG: DUF4369 domain-containing protein, partial [Bacteroidales bacterium]|nr:DUF4369 domain-containing protein [Bacteroidales bacterium]